MSKKTDSEFQTLPRNFKEVYHDLLSAIGFSLIFPISSEQNSQRKLSGALWAIPLVSVLVGIMSLSLAWLVWETFAIWHLTVIIIIVFNLIITGGLHEDGFADVMDAFGVGNGEGAFDKRLAVMKDPNLGTYGVMGLIVLLGSRFLSLSQLDWTSLVVATIVVLPLSRMILPLLLSFVSAARESGLVYLAGKPSLGVATLSVAFAVLPTIILIPKLEYIMLLILTVCLGFIVLRYLSLRLIGGISGDVCGAGVTICELCLWWEVVFINNNSILDYRDLI